MWIVKRFTLRFAFIVLTLSCVAIGLHNARSRSAQQQSLIVSKINGSGNYVIYDYEMNSLSRLFAPAEWKWGVEPYYPPEPRVPAWLIDRFGLDYFCSVSGVQLEHVAPSAPLASAELPDLNGQSHSPGLAEQDGQCSEQLLGDLTADIVKLKNVRLLRVGHIQPDDLEALHTLPRLSRVVFGESVNPRHLMVIANSTVEKVELYGKVDDEQLNALSKSRHLVEVKMPLRADPAHSTFSDVGVKSICACSALTSLTLSSNNVTDKSAKELARLSNLTSLGLRMPNMVRGLPESVAGKPLRSLFICDMVVDERTFAAIGKLSALDTLCIHKPKSPCHLSPRGLAALCNLKRLTRLRLEGFDLGLPELRSLLSNAPIRYLYVDCAIPKENGERIVSEFPSLELYSETERTYDNMRFLYTEQYLGDQSRAVSLGLDDCTN